MCQRVPIPELTEQHHANDSAGIPPTSTALQADGDIAATGIDEALTDGGTEASHGVLVLVGDDLRVQGARRGHRWRRGLRLLHENHAESNEGTLADEVNAILRHGLEDLDSVLRLSQDKSRKH